VGYETIYEIKKKIEKKIEKMLFYLILKSSCPRLVYALFTHSQKMANL